jgi:hypothetical protein
MAPLRALLSDRLWISSLKGCRKIKVVRRIAAHGSYFVKAR